MQSKGMRFDGPTAALDPEMIKEGLDVMVELADTGRTMLCVTHEMGFARTVANRVIFMDRGEIIEQNEPEEFFNNPQSARTRLFLSQILAHCRGGRSRTCVVAPQRTPPIEALLVARDHYSVRQIATCVSRGAQLKQG